MHFTLPFKFRRRDRNMFAALRSDKPLTSLQILKSDFGGQFPPPGLDFKPTERLNQHVRFREFAEDDDSSFLTHLFMRVAAAGYVTGKDANRFVSKKHIDDDDRVIYLNSFLLGGTGGALFQYFTYSLWKQIIREVKAAATLSLGIVGSLIDFGFVWSSNRYSYLNFLLSPLNLRNFPSSRSVADVVAHEHIHVLQVKDKNKPFNESIIKANHEEDPLLQVAYSRLSKWHKFKKVADQILGWGMARYLSSDLELQARLHVAILHDFKRWGRIPENRHELWAALIDSGIRAPRSIRREVAQAALWDPNIKHFMTRSAPFRLAASVVFDTSAEINVARAHFSKIGQKEYFWHDVLPYLYGHLMELYGDPSGRRKMGFRANEHSDTVAEKYFDEHPDRRDELPLAARTRRPTPRRPRNPHDYVEIAM